jgi:HPt (histidine-containing phosphotransfer) domain-containing protein
MDVKDIAAELGLSVEVTQMLVDEFIDSIEGDVKRLEQAIEDQAFRDVEEIAHYICGGASNLRFKNLALFFKEIENAACRGDVAFDYAQTIVNIRRELNV